MNRRFCGGRARFLQDIVDRNQCSCYGQSNHSSGLSETYYCGWMSECGPWRILFSPVLTHSRVENQEAEGGCAAIRHLIARKCPEPSCLARVAGSILIFIPWDCITHANCFIEASSIMSTRTFRNKIRTLLYESLADKKLMYFVYI